MLSVSITTASSVGSLDMSWCQIGMLKHHALRVLSRAPLGGFVIRNSQSSPQHFVLSYVGAHEIVHSLIRTASDSRGDTAVFLDSQRGLMFQSIQDLVVYFTLHLIDEDGVSLVLPERWRAHSSDSSSDNLIGDGLSTVGSEDAISMISGQTMMSSEGSILTTATSLSDSTLKSEKHSSLRNGRKRNIVNRRATFVPRQSSDVLSAYPDLQVGICDSLVVLHILILCLWPCHFVRPRA